MRGDQEVIRHLNAVLKTDSGRRVLASLCRLARTLPTLSFLFIAGAVWAWWEWRKIEPESAEDLAIPAANPLQLTTALIFAGLFLAISLVTAWVESIFIRSESFALFRFSAAEARP
jgi:uncharacterized membrane protein (DUF4010 family)